jgi:hypothetical protein
VSVQVAVDSSCDEFLTPVQVSLDWPFLTPSRLERLRAAGEGPPFVRPSRTARGQVFYRRGAVVDWLQEMEMAR